MRKLARGLRGIRGRLTALSVVLVAATLLVGWILFANLLHRVLVSQLEASVQSEAGLIGGVLAEEGPGAVRSAEFTASFHVQVLDAGGTVLFSSPPRATPISAQRPAPGTIQSEGARPWWQPFGPPPPDVVGAAGVAFDGTTYTVLVGASQRQADALVSAAAAVTAVTAPLLLLLTAALSWWLVGRALGPVEAIRTRVETLSATTLSARVPVPPTEDEISSLATTMNGMLGRLQDARAAQLRFVSDASHELRSPVTAIAGAVELMSAEPAAQDGQLGELIPLVEAETARLGSLIQDMLFLARADAQPPRPGPLDVDLDDLAGAEVRRLRLTSALRVQESLKATRVSGDPEALARALRNLCDNAARHAAGTVRIATEHADGAARLSVEDDGDGVAADDRERIFERFVRLDVGRSRDAGGSGLGLAIVRQVAASHGGRVTVDDSPTLGGARFVLTLPLSP